MLIDTRFLAKGPFRGLYYGRKVGKSSEYENLRELSSSALANIYSCSKELELVLVFALPTCPPPIT